MWLQTRIAQPSGPDESLGSEGPGWGHCLPCRVLGSLCGLDPLEVSPPPSCDNPSTSSHSPPTPASGSCHPSGRTEIQGEPQWPHLAQSWKDPAPSSHCGVRRSQRRWPGARTRHPARLQSQPRSCSQKQCCTPAPERELLERRDSPAPRRLSGCPAQTRGHRICGPDPRPGRVAAPSSDGLTSGKKRAYL